MDPFELVQFFPLSSHKEEDDKVDEHAVALFEEFWFFDNLLFPKTNTIFTCSSTATNFDPELVQNVVAASDTPMVGVLDLDLLDANMNQVLLASEDFRRDTRIGEVDDCDLGVRVRKSTETASSNCLYRTPPSLPSFIGREELMIQDMERDHGLSELFRQASLRIPPKPLPPRTTYKGMTQPSLTPGGHQRRISRVKSMNMDKIYETRHQYLHQNNKITRKSLSDLETEEVQGFKDLGFIFEKDDITPNVVDILPGLQEKKRVESDNNVRRPYLSEAWLPQRSSPSIPNWSAERSTEDMKAHIKFWARAVASNVRQD